MARFLNLVIVLGSLALPFMVLAETSLPSQKILNFQSRLFDSSGAPLGGSGTSFCFKFSIYDDRVVGSPDQKIWPATDPEPMVIGIQDGFVNTDIDDIDIDFLSAFLNIEIGYQVNESCDAAIFENLNPRQIIEDNNFNATNPIAKFKSNNSTDVTIQGNPIEEELAIKDKVSASTLELQNSLAGSVLFAGVDSLIFQNNNKLFWDNTNYRLGIGTSSPLYSLDVAGGQTRIEISDQFGRRLCHSGENIVTSQSVVLGDCSDKSGNIVEYFGANEPLESGDLVRIANFRNQKAFAQKTNGPSDMVLGIVSEDFYDAFGYVYETTDNPAKIALIGRTLAKVSTENGIIREGDLIAPSTRPGVGMKATRAGYVVGHALQPLEQCDTVCSILVTLNPHWQSSESSLVNNAEILDKIRLRDKKTKEIYCVWLENGEWQKRSEPCEDVVVAPQAIFIPNVEVASSSEAVLEIAEPEPAQTEAPAVETNQINSEHESTITPEVVP